MHPFGDVTGEDLLDGVDDCQLKIGEEGLVEIVVADD